MRLPERNRVAVATIVATALTAICATPSANADYTSQVVDNKIQMIGDTDSDRLEIGTDSVAGGLVLQHSHSNDPGFSGDIDFDSSKPGFQVVFLPPSASAQLRINAGRGDDEVAFRDEAARLLGLNGTVEILGGDGDDDLSGTERADLIDGGLGNDRITGGKSQALAKDDLRGFAGNDVFVWAHGDRDQNLDGGDGQDAVDVRTSSIAADDVLFETGPSGSTTSMALPGEPGRRHHLGLRVERATVESGGGLDTVDASKSTIPVTLNGGSGADVLRGGTGADLIQGGDGGDALTGGGASDRLVGDRDDDGMKGGDGDDVLVWNNGDGSDTADGDAGYDVLEVNGSLSRTDDFRTEPGPRDQVRVARTNGASAQVDTRAEALDLNALGGDDSFAAGAGLPIAIDADGGAGNDTLTGAGGADRLFGGADDDTLTGGAGGDAIDGASGGDTIAARDGAPDVVRCGDGVDRAVTDAIATDAPAACEVADAAASPPAPRAPSAPGGGSAAPAAAVLPRVTSPGGRVRARRRGKRLRATLPLACPAGGAECAGVATLTTARPVRAGRARVLATIGRVRYRVAAGSSRRLTLTLPRGTESLARRRRLAVRVGLQSQSADGLAAAGRQRLTIALPQPKKEKRS